MKEFAGSKGLKSQGAQNCADRANMSTTTDWACEIRVVSHASRHGMERGREKCFVLVEELTSLLLSKYDS